MGTARTTKVTVSGITADANDVSVSSAGGQAAIIYPAVPASGNITPAQSHVIKGLMVGYSRAPAAGSDYALSVTDGANLVRVWYLPPVAGIYWVPCELAGTPGQSLTIALAAGGGSAIAFINVEGHRLEN